MQQIEKAKQQEDQKAAAEEQRAQILKAILSPEARERMCNIVVFVGVVQVSAHALQHFGGDCAVEAHQRREYKTPLCPEQPRRRWQSAAGQQAHERRMRRKGAPQRRDGTGARSQLIDTGAEGQLAANHGLRANGTRQLQQ